jgi:hypothetical protein
VSSNEAARLVHVLIVTPSGESGLLDVLEPARPRDPPQRLFSPTEQAIVSVLGSGGWKTGGQLAALTNWGKSTSFQAILTNLVEAGILESSHKRGYRLSVRDTTTPIPE